jgi:hypothetical protein
MTAQELVDVLNAKKFYDVWDVEEELDGAGAKEVAQVDLDEHRWYVLGTTVFQIGDEFIGIRGPLSLKSETMSYSDIGVACKAFMMEQIPSVTYREVGK